MIDESEWRARFEDMGEEEVRGRLATFRDEPKSLAFKWLRERTEAAKAKQGRANRTTEIASIAAAVAALIAAVFAALAWLYPRH